MREERRGKENQGETSTRKRNRERKGRKHETYRNHRKEMQ